MHIAGLVARHFPWWRRQHAVWLLACLHTEPARPPGGPISCSQTAWKKRRFCARFVDIWQFLLEKDHVNSFRNTRFVVSGVNDRTTKETVAMPNKRSTDKSNNGDSHTLIPRSSDDLAIFQHAFDELACADSVEDVKTIRDRAEAVRVLVREARAGLELQNRVAELKLRAERRAGELLLTMSLRGGDRRSDKHTSRPTLDDIGISQGQSKRWQKEALVPEDDFRQLVASAYERKVELTSAALLRLATTCSTAPWKEGDGNELVIDVVSEAPRREDAAPVDPRELVSELRNHCRLLDRILSPHYEGGDPIELPGGQRRLLRRLMRELMEILAELSNHVSAAERE